MASNPPTSLKLLDLNSIQQLPDSHVWKPIDEYDTGEAILSPESLPPVIDLSDPNAVELIGDACKTWGVFQITNHGVPASFVDDMEKATKSLFALPLEQKLKAARAPGSFPGYGQTIYSHLFSQQMWFEGFNIFGSPLERAQKLWPHDYHKFCDVVEKYQEGMITLRDRLMGLMLGSLGIDKDDISWATPKMEPTQTDPRVGLQLNYYPACPEPERAMGLMPHTDSVIFAILHQNQVSGLQIRHENGGWITIPPVPNAFIINVGDLLDVLSNGMYPSVLHRVMVNPNEERVSVVYFYGAPSDVDISPHPKLVDSTRPALYRAINWKEYRVTKGKLFNKALAALRVDFKNDS